METNQPASHGATTDNSGMDTSNAGSDSSLTDKISRSAHEAVDRAAEKAAVAEDAVRSSATRTEEQAQAMALEAEVKGREVLGKVQQYAREHPLESLGIAFAGGLILSRLMRR